jgi:hypothetical protein
VIDEKILLAVTVLILLPAPLWGDSPSGKREDPGISLIFSGNVQGEVEPSG